MVVFCLDLCDGAGLLARDGVPFLSLVIMFAFCVSDGVY